MNKFFDQAEKVIAELDRGFHVFEVNEQYNNRVYPIMGTQIEVFVKVVSGVVDAKINTGPGISTPDWFYELNACKKLNQQTLTLAIITAMGDMHTDHISLADVVKRIAAEINSVIIV